ncbi:MAG: eamA-like transporter family protein [Herbaspirillum sp.]|nr:eamA-like transporter family protein [Herbaspirillum sp.]
MNFIELIILAAVWGASFLFMRVATPEFGPIPLIALRVGIATLVLLPFMRSSLARGQFKTKVRHLLVVGVTSSAIPFCFFAYSTLFVNAGLDSALNATTPLWAALIASIGFQVSMGRQQIFGLLLGFVGVVVLLRDTFVAGVSGVPLAIGAALAATLFYGFTVNYSKRYLAGVPPFVVAFGSQFFASIVLAPLALLLWPAHSISLSAWGCVAALGIVCTGFAYVLFFRLVENVGAAYAASVTFLIPVFGIIWGASFLGEKLTPMMFAGGAIVLLGTAITSGKISWRLFQEHK